MMPLKAYQVNHLFLLMGENPLPNAVAALTLLLPGGTVHILHTHRTRTQAQYLNHLLSQSFGFQAAPTLNLGDGQAEAYGIRQQVQSRLHPLTGTVGMNYTGGTKVSSCLFFQKKQWDEDM
jgi:hypothetical protein